MATANNANNANNAKNVQVQDLSLPLRAVDMIELLNEQLINRKDCLEQLAKIHMIRQRNGIEENSELEEAMRRVWHS